MDEVPKLSRQNYIETMRSVSEETMQRVADAINDAPGGRVIAASEDKVRDLLGEFRRKGYEVGLKMRAALRSPAKRKAADQLLHYVAERRDMIRYPEFLNEDWQIGSGSTEARCKTTTARLERSGMWWDADNADALMALACIEQSGQWKHYWQTRLKPTG